VSLREFGHRSRGFILTINGGSSSLKRSRFHVGHPLTRVVSCLVDRIGFPEGTLTLTDVAGGTSERRTIQAAHHKDSVDPLITWLEQKVANTDLVATGDDRVPAAGTLRSRSASAQELPAGGREYRPHRRYAPVRSSSACRRFGS